jgi:hypothetical protein
VKRPNPKKKNRLTTTYDLQLVRRINNSLQAPIGLTDISSPVILASDSMLVTRRTVHEVNLKYTRIIYMLSLEHPVYHATVSPGP